MLKQRAQRNRHMQIAGDPAEDANRVEAMTAEREEIVVRADAFPAIEDFGPDLRERVLDRTVQGAGLRAPRRRARFGEQRGAIDLAVRCERQPVDEENLRRDEMFRQPFAQLSAAGGGIELGFGSDDERHQFGRSMPFDRGRVQRSTAGCASSTASISRGSTRYPRIFACASLRPRISTRPSGS